VVATNDEGITSFRPPHFAKYSGYTNLSAALRATGGCSKAQLSGESNAGKLEPSTEVSEDAKILQASLGRFACRLSCTVHEDVLERAFAPWWDHKLPQAAIDRACQKVGNDFSQAFLVSVVQGRIWYRCCSTGGGDKCDNNDLRLFLLLVAEVTQEATWPALRFLVNTGDQPFTAKAYWSPVPQFHWTQDLGYWTVPLPNPFHTRGHYSNQLGDNAAHQALHAPWSARLPKVYWRGSLSAPDNVCAEDLDVLPRVRLASIARQHPELFDVAITGVDEELTRFVGKKVVQSLERWLPLSDTEDVYKRTPLYRYVINVSAVLSAWRLAQLLTSGSLLLLQEDSSSELIYEWLQPWEHFVPISNSLSDLVDKVRWLEAHPVEAAAIAARGFQHFQRRVRRQDTYCYVAQALATVVQVSEPLGNLTPMELRRQGGRWLEFKHAATAQQSDISLPLKGLLQRAEGSAADATAADAASVVNNLPEL